MQMNGFKKGAVLVIFNKEYNATQLATFSYLVEMV